MHTHTDHTEDKEKSPESPDSYSGLSKGKGGAGRRNNFARKSSVLSHRCSGAGRNINMFECRCSYQPGQRAKQPGNADGSIVIANSPSHTAHCTSVGECVQTTLY